MHCPQPQQKRKLVNTLVIGFCVTFISFTLLQVYDGFLVSLLTRANPKLFSLQSSNPPKLNSRKYHIKRSNPNSLRTDAAPQPSRTSSAKHPARRNPFVVYRDDKDQIRACVIPRVCSAEPIVSGITDKDIPSFYIPHEYRPYEKILSQCISQYPKTSTFHFYSGEKPSNDITWYDIDVLGRSCTARWHAHFAHFIFHFSKRVLTITSLFRSQGKSTLPRPQCMYPSNNAFLSSSACRKGDIDSLKPRILVSHRVFKHAWTRKFLRFLASGIQTRSKRKQPLLHLTQWSGRTKDMGEQRIECYRSLITTPENFNIDRPGHDSLMQAAGIERAPKCDRKPHIVILSRQYVPGHHRRKVLNSTVEELQFELAKATDASVEWVYGLGRLNFSEQVKLMQRADVLVTVHGAELSNALFLRRGARIIELMPFGLYTKYFKYTVADPIHVKHIAYATNPDPDAFYKCIESGKHKDPLGEARAVYKKHLMVHLNAKNESERQKAGLFFAGIGPRESCIKSQVADFNPRILARTVSREAATRCANIQ